MGILFTFLTRAVTPETHLVPRGLKLTFEVSNSWNVASEGHGERDLTLHAHSDGSF